MTISDLPFRVIVPAGNRHDPYPDQKARDFEDDIKNNESIPLGEKEQWISKMNVGNESPVIALLLPRLHYLTSLTVVLGDCEGFFMLKTLQGIARDPRSTSLSRLRKLDVRGKPISRQRVGPILICAALPSLPSLKAHWLAEGPNISAKKASKLAPQTSSLQHLELFNCVFSQKTLTDVIRSAKWLRSLTFIHTSHGAHEAYAWVAAALLLRTYDSLEELTLCRSDFTPVLNELEHVFQGCRNLRVLTIDWRLLMGDKHRSPNVLVNWLPASLVILKLDGCRVDCLEWLLQHVKWVVQAKGRMLPRLRELNLVKALYAKCYASCEVEKVCAVAGEAGFKMTVSSSGAYKY